MIKRQIIVDNLNIQFYQSDCIGKEKLVILLHGWNSRAKHLKIIFQEMDNFIALDLPGFGESDLPPVVWGVAEYANFLRRFLEKLEIEKPILAGHSFGGSVILKYLANGGRAEKIILVSPSGIRKRGMKIWFYKIVAKIAKSILSLPGASFFRDKIRIKAYKMIDSEDYIEAGALTESYKKIIREDLSEDMKKIQIKTILIWGEKDVATPLAQGELMQKFIKNSKLYIIKTAGHFSFVDQPEEFKKIFLREINAD